jgi:hypothetical protein
MKMTVISDGEGRILATARYDVEGDGPPTAGLSPAPGQLVHEVDVPDAIASMEAPFELLERYQVRVEAREAKLVEITERGPAKSG